MKLEAITLTTATALAASCGNDIHFTDSPGTTVTKDENREYSYTDKKAGY